MRAPAPQPGVVARFPRWPRAAPRWAAVAMTDRRAAHPAPGVAVLGYRAEVFGKAVLALDPTLRADLTSGLGRLHQALHGSAPDQVSGAFEP